MNMIKACRVADIPENGMKQIEVEQGPKVLVLHSAGNYYAYQAMCPHQEVALCEGIYDGSTLTCHEHLWQWNATSGAPVGLAETPLEPYDVEVRGDDIYVGVPSALKLASIFEGVSEPVMASLTELARVNTYPAGSEIYNIGAPVVDLYILEKGRVAFILGQGDRSNPGGFMVRKGELFGWAALLVDQPERIARATCDEDSTVIELNGAEVLAILKDAPEDGLRVMSNLVQLLTRYFATYGSQ